MTWKEKNENKISIKICFSAKHALKKDEGGQAEEFYSSYDENMTTPSPHETLGIKCLASPSGSIFQLQILFKTIGNFYRSLTGYISAYTTTLEFSKLVCVLRLSIPDAICHTG